MAIQSSSMVAKFEYTDRLGVAIEERNLVGTLLSPTINVSWPILGQLNFELLARLPFFPSSSVHVNETHFALRSAFIDEQAISSIVAQKTEWL